MSRSLKADQVAGAFNAVPGVLIRAIDNQVSTDSSTSSATFAAVNANLTVTNVSVPVSGKYKVRLSGAVQGQSLSVFNIGRFRINVDSGNQYVGGDTTLGNYGWDIVSDEVGKWHGFAFEDEVELTAGSHDFSVEWARMTGDGSVFTNNAINFRLVLEMVSGSGAGGTLLALVENSTDLSTSTPATPYELTPLNTTFTVADGEDVLATLHLNTLKTGGTYPDTCNVSYKIDTGSWVLTYRHWIQGASYPGDVSLSIPLVGLSAGSHTLKWGIHCDGTGTLTAAGTGITSKSAIWQYRGGLVPIKQDGTLIQDKPQAINAIGPGLQATNVDGQVNLSVQSAAEGLETVEATPLSSDKQLSDTYADTGLTLNVSVVEGEYLVVSFMASVWTTSGTKRNVSTKLVSSIDGDLFESPNTGTDTTSYNHCNAGWTQVVGPLSAGTHTLKIQAKQDSGTDAYIAELNDSFQVARFRGGYVTPENIPVLSYNSASVVNVQAGPGASSRLQAQLNDGIRRYATSPLTIDLTVSGEGGLDTGSEAVSTWYYCYLVPKASDDTQLVALCSVTPPTTGPTGYSKWKYIGAVRNDASGNLLVWYQEGAKFRYQTPRWQAVTPVGYSQFDASAFVPATASSVGLTVTADYGSTWASIYLYPRGQGGSYPALTVNAGSDPFNSSWVDLPVTGSPRGFDYQVVGTGATGNFIFCNWTDNYLLSLQATLQAKYQADTSSPKGTWASVSTVNFAARPGQPTYSRLTLQDGKMRVAASSTLAWAIANGVADLGYDEAGSQGNSKWLYFYAVPKSGDDNQFTVRASDNPPSTGPAGYSNWKSIWSTYIDGSGNLVKVYQSGNEFFYDARQDIINASSVSPDGSVQTVSAATVLPVTASKALINSYIANNTTDQWYLPFYASATSSDTCSSIMSMQNNRSSMTNVLPLTTAQTIYKYLQRLSGSSTLQALRVSAVGWTDEWIDP